MAGRIPTAVLDVPMTHQFTDPKTKHLARAKSSATRKPRETQDYPS